jgi:hypothetical protein
MRSANTAGFGDNAKPAPELVQTVRYSLPELLAELRLERVSGSFAMEKLHQTEIGKIFQAQPKRRRAKPRS